MKDKNERDNTYFLFQATIKLKTEIKVIVDAGQCISY